MPPVNNKTITYIIQFLKLFKKINPKINLRMTNQVIRNVGFEKKTQKTNPLVKINK